MKTQLGIAYNTVWRALTVFRLAILASSVDAEEYRKRASISAEAFLARIPNRQTGHTGRPQVGQIG